MRFITLPVALAATAFVATVCVAQSGPGPRAGQMMRADTNGDGVVTRAEVLAQAGARFDKLDANHDGKLDQSELSAMGGRRGDARPDGATPPPPGE